MISNRPKKINFFSVNDGLFLVDLPGYGYARVPAAVKRNWGPMIESYLKGRETLKAVVLILDIRRTPGVEEQNFIDWLELYRRIPIVVLTKVDKLSKSGRKKQRQTIAAGLNMDEAALILFSAKSRLGRSLVWSAIEDAAFSQDRNHE